MPKTMETPGKDALRELLETRQYKALRARLAVLKPASIAELLADLSEDEAMISFRLLPKDLAVAVFDHMDGTSQKRLLESFSDQAARALLEAMPHDDRVDLLDEVPAIVARRLLRILSSDQRHVTLQLLGYEEGTAGREMNPLFVDIRSDMTIAEALDKVRQLAIARETIYECYVIDQERHLIGSVSLRDLVIAPLDARVADIMKTDPPFVFVHTDREEAARVLRQDELTAVPVVDAEERLVGIITHDDVVDILEEEATEDIYRFGAVPGTERGYFTSRILTVVRRRVVWLLLLIVVNTVTGLVIAGQSALLTEVVILAAFLPLLIDTGGNIGSQSATVVIRGLATREITQKRALAIVAREAGVGLVLGVVLGLIVFLWSYLLGRDLRVATVVTLTLTAISIIATMTGSALPFLFRAIKVDPAMVSAPLITTVLDIFGIVLYFGIARLLLI